MRVELTIDGGFAYLPGLAKPMVVDTAHLSAAESAQLKRLCAAALAIAGHKAKPPPATLYDARRYHLTIDIDGVKRDIDATDPVNDPALADLIGFVTTVSRR